MAGAGLPRRGEHTGALVGLADLAPTMLDLLLGRAPDEMQGTSVAPVVRGEAESVLESVPIYLPVPVDQAVLAGVPAWRGVRTERYSYAREQRGKGWVLYDNEEDPLQQRNLIDDPAHAGLREQMEEQTDAWLERMDDPCLPPDDMIRHLDLVEEWNLREETLKTAWGQPPHLIRE
jgi:arylsulfatase A-like enzyme